MRYLVIGLAALAAVPAVAYAADSMWGSFEADQGGGVGLQAADGAQLLIKCDKQGARSVYAVVSTKEALVPPALKPVMRPVTITLDGRPPFDDRWRFLGNTAAAVNAGNEASLTRFLGPLSDAQTLQLDFYNDPARRAPTTVRFNVAGAKAAIAQAFSTCKDQPPAG
jgi:hypothetical protein